MLTARTLYKQLKTQPQMPWSLTSLVSLGEVAKISQQTRPESEQVGPGGVRTEEGLTERGAQSCLLQEKEGAPAPARAARQDLRDAASVW